MAVSLLDLPNELIIEVLSQLDGPTDLMSAIRASPLIWRVFHAAALTIVRRLGEHSLGGEFGMRTALALHRLSQLRCTHHTTGCPDRSPCARRIFESYARQSIPPLLNEETRHFLHVLNRVDRVIDQYHERVPAGLAWTTKPCCEACVKTSRATFGNPSRHILICWSQPLQPRRHTGCKGSHCHQARGTFTYVTRHYTRRDTSSTRVFPRVWRLEAGVCRWGWE
jgi:hypothetical protein